jgi:putative membrane protein
MDHGFGWHELWGYWWLFMIFWWCGGTRIVGAAAHRSRHSRDLARREDSALATLRERYARGEIDRAEYEERRAVLRGRPVAASATSPRGDGPAWPDLP